VSSSCRGGRHRSHEGDDEREASKSGQGALNAASGGRSRSGDIAGAPISVRRCPPSSSVSFDGGPFDVDPGLALADRREATLAASHAPDQDGPDSNEDESGTTQDASRVSQVFSRAPVKRTFAASSSRTRSGSQTSVATSAARGGTSCEVPSRVEQVRRALHDRGPSRAHLREDGLKGGRRNACSPSAHDDGGLCSGTATPSTSPCSTPYDLGRQLASRRPSRRVESRVYRVEQHWGPDGLL